MTTNNTPPDHPEFRLWAGSHDNGLSKRTGLAGTGTWITESQTTTGLLPFTKGPDGPVAGDAGMVRGTRSHTVIYMVRNSDITATGSNLVFWGKDANSQNWHRLSDDATIKADRTFPFYPALDVSPTEHTFQVFFRPVTRNWAAVGSTVLWQREAAPLTGPLAFGNWAWRWRQISPELNGDRHITAIFYVNDNLIFVGYDNGRIYRMEVRDKVAPGKHNENYWTRFDILPAGGNPLPGGVNGNWRDRRINALTVDRANPNIVYVGVDTFEGGRQIWRTADGGATWNALNGAGATALPNLPVHTIRFLATPQRTEVYVGNDAGVYVTRDVRNPAWERLDGNNLPYVQVKDLQWVGDTRHLIAATYGRGAYHIEVPIPPPPPRPKENGRVWEDQNGNGLQDSGEPGLSGVAVDLYDAAGAKIASTATNSAGFYYFDDLDPGTYYVHSAAPSGHEFTSPGQGGNPFLDSDASPTTGDTSLFTLQAGEERTGIDAGLFRRTSVGDRVWRDDNANGLQDQGEFGLGGVGVALYDAAGTLIASAVTTGDGSYSFGNLKPGAYVIRFTRPGGYSFTLPAWGSDPAVDSDAVPSTGWTLPFVLLSGQPHAGIDAGLILRASTPITRVGSRVWYDANSNGLQDLDELGFDGVTVRLLDVAGAPLASVTTDSDGFYQFTGLLPGTYQVEFAAPSGYRFTDQDRGDDTLDSDAYPPTGRSPAFTLGANEEILTIDAGLIFTGEDEYGMIGDYVWDDLDGDGLQDADEPGVSGVTVNLLDEGGAVLASTSTYQSGYYELTGVAPGNYRLKFVRPSGYRFTLQDRGNDDAADSDADPDTGQTAVFTLAAGQNDGSWDAGLFLSDLPEVHQLEPSFGPTNGGTSVVITGYNLGSVTTVLFGNVGAMFEIDSDTQIIAIAPAQAAQTVDVTVVSPSGNSAVTPNGAYTYVAAPIRTDPGFTLYCLSAGGDGSSGPVSLGFTINFFGGMFSQAFVNENGSVTFGGPLGANFTPSPLGSAPLPIIAPFWGDVDTAVGPRVCYGTGLIDGRQVLVVNWVAVGYYAAHTDKTNIAQLVLTDRSNVAAGAFDIEFNYQRVTWETGDASGGNNGLGGTSARAGYSNGTGTAGTFYELAGSGTNGLLLDSNPVTGLIHNSQNSSLKGRYVFQIRSGGFAPLGGGGQAAAAPAASGPVVGGVKAPAGPTTGGTVVTLIGSGFTGVSGVFFGSTPAVSFVVQSPQRIVATAPARAAGTVNVRVVTSAGTSPIAAANRFTYVPAPAVTAVSAAAGPTRGGASVVLTGSNFVGARQVLFGTTEARSFQVLSPTQLRVLAPPRLPGPVDVRVVAAGGTSPVSPIARYTYVPAPRVSALSRATGPTTGGIVLTLTGANFTGATAVLFGTTPAAIFTVLSPTQVRVTVPARPAGTVDVRVVTAGGGSPAAPAARFTYTGGLTAASTAAPGDPGGSEGALLDAADVDLVMTLLYVSEDESDFAPVVAP